MLHRRMISFAVFAIGLLAADGTEPVLAQGAKPAPARGAMLLGVAFSRDSSIVATCGDRDRVRVFEVESGKLVREIESRLTRSVAFSPTDRDLFATAGDDGLVRLWRVSEPDVVREMPGHVGMASCVAFDASGRVLASGSRSYQNGKADIGQLRLWDVGTGKVIRSLDFKEAAVDGVSFSGDGQFLAFCESSRVQIYRVRTWEPVTTITLAAAKLENGPYGKANPFGMATLFASNERLIVAGGICVPVSPEEAAPYSFACRTTGLVWGVDLSNPASAKLLDEPRPGYRRSLSLTPDGKRFATGFGSMAVKVTKHFTEMRTDSDGKLVWKSEGGMSESYGISISPDGRFVAVCQGEHLQVLNAETGATVRTITAGN